MAELDKWSRIGAGWRGTTIVAMAGLLLLGLYIKFEQRNLKLHYYDQRERVTGSLLGIAQRLEATLNNRLFLTHSIESYVHARESVTADEFLHLAESLVHSLSKEDLRSLQIVRGTTIEHVYPLEGNEGVLGQDLLSFRGQAEAVRRTIDGKEMVLAGPMELVQGGKAVVARKPIFIGDGGEQRYWGLATVIIDWETLRREAGITKSADIRIAIRGSDARGRSGPVFFGSNQVFDSMPVMVPVTIPGGDWILGAIPREGWPERVPDQGLLRTIAALVVMVVLLTTWMLLRYPLILRAKVQRATRELEQGKTMLERRVGERTAELRESEQRMRNLMDAVPFPVVVTEIREDKCFYANQPALALFEETSAEQVEISRKYYVLPEQRQELLGVLQRDGRVTGFEVALKSSKDKRFWALISAVPLVLEGKEAMLVAVADISERKTMEVALADSEYKLRTIFNSVQTSMAIVRWSDGVVLRVNEATKERAGITDAHLGQLKASDIYCRTSDREKMLQQLELHGSVHDMEVCMRSVSGEEATMLLSATFIEYEGEPCILSSYTEITERKRVEEALQRANQEAELAIRSKNEFLATMSHEIRTPLNGMLTMLQLLSRTELTLEQQEFVSAIDYSGEALLTILNDVLDLSKLEAGRIELEETDFDVHRLLDDMVRLMKHRTEKSRLHLYLSFDQRIPRLLRGDQTRIRQVLLNLLGNAIKFTEVGVVELKAACLQEVDGRVRVEFSVRDTGIGITKRAQEHLFDSFTQADSSVARRYGGTGLGLAICRRMVELMGGEIGVISEEGKGSNFWFRLELVRAVETGTEPLSSANLRATGLGRLKVLLVEDEMINRRAGALLLRKEGAEVVTAADGYEALERFRDGPFDVVLMDVRMPGMDGLETTLRLRDLEGGSEVPVFALTADVTRETVERCLVIGMRGVIAKPLRLERLTEALASLMKV